MTEWLQSLAGTAPQFSSAIPLLENSQQDAVVRLVSIQDMLADEQREFRSFIRALGPRTGDAAQGEVALVPHLVFLAERFRWQWDIELRCKVTPAEVTANAVCHGGAKAAATAVVVVATRWLPRSWTMDVASRPRAASTRRNSRRGLGPRRLDERAAEWGGCLAVEAGPAGAHIAVEVPLARGAAGMTSARSS
jgi:signal transduction histidine kinase